MRTLTIAAAALALHCAAAAEPVRAKAHPFAMSGDRLVALFLRPSETPEGSRPASAFQDHEMAKGYLSGVKDSTVGTIWCYPGRVKPAELDWDIIGALQKLPHDALHVVAAPLVVKYLASKFPCRP